VITQVNFSKALFILSDVYIWLAAASEV